MTSPTSFIRKLFQLRLFLVINVLLLFFLAVSFGREYLHNASIERQITELEQERAALETRNLEILSVSETIQTQFFLEKEGRLKHGLRKPGEQLVVVTPEVGALDSADSSVSDTLAETTADPGRMPNPMRWWLFFFNPVAFQEMRTYALGG